MNRQAPSPPQADAGQYRSLQILDELANNDALSQRDLSRKLGIALGLVNSYIKNLIAKGYITVKNIPSKRYAYYLTPKGFAEKTRLAYDLLHDYTRIYREAKSGFQKLFHELEAAGVKRVVFAGADEVAEIAYITLQDTGLEIAGIIDDERAGDKFFGRSINPFSEIRNISHEVIVVTSYLKRGSTLQRLLDSGIGKQNIRTIFLP